MNSTLYIANNNLAMVEAYYEAMIQKDFDTMEKYLHPNVHFLSPLAEMTGKEAVATAAKNLSGFCDGIEIRAKFSTDNQVMLAYAFMFQQPIGKLRAAVLMDIEDALIKNIELFYDGRPFDSMKDKIFSQE